jgi:hypothetical protein
MKIAFLINLFESALIHGKFLLENLERFSVGRIIEKLLFGDGKASGI